MPPVASATERATKAAPPAPPAAPVVEKLAPAGKGGREQSEADYRRAMTLVNGARVQEATDVLLDVLSRDGSHTASRQLLARLLIEQRRLDEAYAILAEGLALQPGQVGWAMTLARLQFEQGKVAEAERTMAAHRRHGERSPDYLAFHGLLLEKLDRRDEARAAYLKARESGKLTPELAEAIEQRLR